MSKRSIWLAGIAAAAVLAAGPVCAQPAYPVNIAATGLEPALLSLASQTKQQIFFPKALVAGLHSQALKGSFTPEQALARLLAGTDLRVRRVSPELIVVERTGPPASIIPAGGEGQAQRPFATDASAPGVVGAPALHGEASASVTTPAPVLVEEVEITGSHIRGASTASPLLVLSHADLERSGQTTVVDALRALPQNFGGGASEGTLNTGGDPTGRNGAFGSALNLRGLGNNATLVLVNGRRMAGSGTFGDFADVSSIPSVAVERVEVLLDGASALYGSDAVGGVVNIITRKDYEGAETRVLGGIGTAGEPAQGQISQTFGKRWTGGGLVFAYELQRRDSLAGGARPFSADADLRALGGTDRRQTNSFPGNILRIDPVTRALVPGWAIPPGQTGVGLRPTDLAAGTVNLQNQRVGEDILPKQTLNALYLAADQALGARLEISGDARFSSRRFKSHQGPASSTFTVDRNNPFYVSPIGAASESIAYSFAGDLPNPLAAGSVENLSLTFGGSLKLFADWRSEAYATFAQAIEEVRNTQLLNSVSLSEALGRSADRVDTPFRATRDGFFNPFTGIPGSNNPAVLGYIGSGFIVARSRDRVSSVNFQADGSLWSLPAGAMKLALGAQARRETLVRSASNYVSSAAPVAQPGTDVGRDVTAAFLELNVPLFGPANAQPGLQRLDLSVAGRVEHYEGIGTTANPKLGIQWSPVADLQLRGTYGRSFRAPALRETNDPSVYSPSLLTLGAGSVLSLILGGGNPSLKPETATSWTFGADFRPSRWPGLSLSATGFDIRFHNRIDRPVQTNLVNALTDPTLSSFVTRISPGASSADRALIAALLASPALDTRSGVFEPEAYGAIADNRYVNTATLHVKGMDVAAAYAFDLGEDHVALSAQATYLFAFDQQVTPTSPVVDRVNIANFPVRFRSRVTADWTRDRLTVGGAFNYIGRYHDSLGVRIGSQPTFDLQARLAPPGSGVLKGVSVLLNVRNVFDRDPPFYDNPVGIGYDAANADPIGRFVSLQLKRAW